MLVTFGASQQILKINGRDVILSRKAIQKVSGDTKVPIIEASRIRLDQVGSVNLGKIKLLINTVIFLNTTGMQD
jgi:hypothetical protein